MFHFKFGYYPKPSLSSNYPHFYLLLSSPSTSPNPPRPHQVLYLSSLQTGTLEKGVMGSLITYCIGMQVLKNVLSMTAGTNTAPVLLFLLKVRTPLVFRVGLCVGGTLMQLKCGHQCSSSSNYRLV